MKKRLLILLCLISFCFTLSGCLPVVAGGAAAGGYYVGKSDRSITQIADDAAITTSVKTRLIAEKKIKAGKIDVDTNKGIVVLSGRVSTESEKLLAASIAYSVNGVKSVKNGLAVIP